MKRIMSHILVAVMFCLTLTGCGIEKQGEKSTKIVLTTGFGKDEIFRIEKMSCTLPEIMVYLMNTKNEYEEVFGEEIWEATKEGKDLQSQLKERVIANIARIKAMNLMAEKEGISLNEEELSCLQEIAHTYYASLTTEEIEALSVTEDLIYRMYQEKALADKIYDYLIADINPEISDDEARTIKVACIFFKTYHLDEKGNKQEFSEQSKQETYEKAKEALQRAKDGENFDALITEYSDSEEHILSFGKGTYEEAFEKVAFDLATGEVSHIITADDGYAILKCISTFDRDETDRNKLKIVEEKRKEVFNEEYSTFITGLTKALNEKLWDTVTFITEPKISTSSFFDMYTQMYTER